MVHFDGRKFTADTNKLLKEATVYTIYPDWQGSLWFGTASRGLIKLSAGKYRQYGEVNNIKNERIVLNILQDRNDKMWVSRESGGLILLKDESKLTYDKNCDLSESNVWSIYEDTKGNMWIGTIGKGLFLAENYHIRRSEVFRALDDVTIWGVTEDKFGNIWIATDTRGIYKYDGNALTNFTASNGLSSNSIACITTDRSGNIWSGTNGFGVDKFTSMRFVHYREEDGLSSSQISCVYMDRENRIWVGTEQAGLNVFEEGRWKKFADDPGLSSATIKCLYEDRQGQLWVGTEEKGAYVIRDNKITRHLASAPRPFSHIVQNREGVYYVCSIYDGLYKSKDGQNFQKLFSASHNKNKATSTYTLLCDKRDNIWVGTLLNKGVGGMYFLEEDTLLPFRPEEFHDKSIWDLYEDEATGNIWIGTGEKGLYLLKKDTLLNFTVDDGLSSNIVYNVLIDQERNLWITSEKGLDKITFTADHKIEALQHYSKQEGLLGIETTLKSLIQDNKGSVWIGTNKALTRYSPWEDRQNDTPPLTRITGLRLNYEPVNWEEFEVDSIDPWTQLPDGLVLSYDQNHITFDFIGINHTIPEKVKYRYKLEGADNDWSPMISEQKATYTNLSPGTYEFKLLAANENGIWNDKPVYFKFEIRPPFYQTWWFYLLVLFVAVAVLYAYQRFRERKLIEQQKILENKVKERTAQLKEAYDNINVQKKEIDESIRYAKKIQEAILPDKEVLKNAFPESFIYYQPKDVVSGDFYWFADKGSKLLLAAVDCTGHGVPGAFMSMIGSNLLNQLATSEDDRPDHILENLHQQVRNSLKQHLKTTESKDGMDMALLSIDKESRKVEYAGAYRPLYLVREGNLEEIKADKQAIGGYQAENKRRFSNHLLPLKKGDILYVFSDGYADQFV